MIESHMSEASSRRRWRGDPASVIEVLQGNPKRLGSKCRERFQRYRNGMTVEQYVTACATAPRPMDAWIDLTWDEDRDFIKIHPPGTRLTSHA
jgi:hypothetical protein